MLDDYIHCLWNPFSMTVRAEKLGLNPPKEVKEQLDRGAAKDSVLEDAW